VINETFSYELPTNESLNHSYHIMWILQLLYKIQNKSHIVL